MSVLTKNTRRDYTPGTRGVPATPGSPAVPAHYETRTQLVLRQTGYFITKGGNGAGAGTKIFISTGWVQTLETTNVFVPARAAVAPTPGVPGTLASFSADHNLGWNAGATSIAVLAGDGTLQFSVPVSVQGVVAGLNDSNTGSEYREINYGFYISDGGATVYEHGVPKSAVFAYDLSTVFSVRRSDEVVSYYVDTDHVYTSGERTAAVLVADASMYGGGDAIHGATLDGEEIAYDGRGSSAARMQPIEVYAYDGDYADGISRLQPVTSEATGRAATSITALMRPLVSVASNYAYTHSAGRLEPVESQAHPGTLTPGYSISDNYLAYILSASYGLTGGTGGGDTLLAPLASLAADHAYGEGRAVLEPLTAAAGVYAMLTGLAQLTNPRRPVLSASGTQGEPNAFRFSYKGTLTASAGAYAKLKAPRPELLSTGVGVIIGRARLVAPHAPVLVASGSTGAVALATMIAPRPTVSGFTGAVLSVRIGGEVTVMGSGMRGAVGRAVMRLPLCRLVASGSSGVYGEARLTAPALIPTPSGRATLSAKYKLVAYGSAVVTATYEAYAVNMLTAMDQSPQNQYESKHAAVTHYTNFPFTQIVRHEKKYYGVAPDGLYLLDGDTDDGEPIAWSFRTALTDSGSKQLKRVKSVYIGARLLNEVTVTLVVGEEQALSYDYKTPRGSNAQTYRQMFGKGVRTRYLALEMSDPLGNFIEIDSLDLELDILERAI
jgi:hypothetical protein